MARAGSRFYRPLGGEQGTAPAPSPLRSPRHRQAANDNRAPLLHRLMPALVALAGLVAVAASLYGYLG